jgi:hypothetical protein
MGLGAVREWNCRGSVARTRNSSASGPRWSCTQNTAMTPGADEAPGEGGLGEQQERVDGIACPSRVNPVAGGPGGLVLGWPREDVWPEMRCTAR